MAATPRCARPGCGVVATAWLSYDYAGQQVWLDDAAATAGGHRCALCSAHAGRLRAPKGWSFQDRRTLHPARPLPPLIQAAPANPATGPERGGGPAEPSSEKARPVAV